MSDIMIDIMFKELFCFSMLFVPLAYSVRCEPQTMFL